MGAKKILPLLLLVTFFISGCYIHPVRHLAADVALLKKGETTQEEVLVYLGEPDEQKEMGDGVVKWLYKDEKKTAFEKTPGLGKYLGSPEYLMVVVTITNGIVTDTLFSSTDDDELDWADDYSWQEKAQ